MNTLDQVSQRADQPEKKLNKKELRAEEMRQRRLVTETIYPILLKNAKNIKDAKNVIKNFLIALDAGFQIDIRKYSEFRSQDRLTTLNLKGLMNEGKENSTEWEWTEALKDEKISTVKGLLSGLDRELQRLTDKELMERNLDTLKTEWLWPTHKEQ